MSIYDKEYTLGEAICEIEKDNKKVFKDKDYKLFCGQGVVEIVMLDTNETVGAWFGLDRKWKLQKPEPQEVGFMEAVKARKIMCKFEYVGSAIFEFNEDTDEFKDENGECLTPYHIIKGKWYILED